MTPEYRIFIQELFSVFGVVDVRRMFGVHGLFCEETMFGLVADERVFLKTSEKSRTAFVDGGTPPFRFLARDGSEIVTSYYEMPARLYDEPEEAAAWARTAYEVALRSPTATRGQRKQMKAGSARQSARRRKRS